MCKVGSNKHLLYIGFQRHLNNKYPFVKNIHEKLLLDNAWNVFKITALLIWIVG